MNPESMLKGRMTETLVEGMLRKSGNRVYRFGYEAILQNLVQIEDSFDKHTTVGEQMRAIPDFVVIDTKSQPTLVEVKFRRDPDARPHHETIDILERVEKYWNATIIFVNALEQPYFRVSPPPYFKNVSQPLKGYKTEPLISVAAWNISEEVYAEYENLVKKYLASSQ